MAKKKTLLVLLLVVSLALMLVIVYFIKTRYGYFGYSYHQYIEDMALKYDAAVETNLSKINSDIQYLSKDNLVKSVFVSSGKGESTGNYYPDFDKIRNAIEDCQKLQILDFDGKIIFSVDTNEINKIKIVRQIMTAVKDHFLTNDFAYIYLLNKDLLASFYSVPVENTSTTNGGFVVLYYKMNKLFSGIPRGSIVADGAISNLLVTSRMFLNNNKVNYLMDYMKNPETFTKIETNEKSVYVVRKNIHGIELLYYPSNEKFIPILGGIALTACLLLFFLVVTALVLILRDEKVIQDMPVKPVNVSIHEEPVQPEKPDELKDLIKDIEENKPYGESEAKKGIEDMIMANGIHLTEAMPEISSEYMDMEAGTPSAGEKIKQPEKLEIPEPSQAVPENLETYDFIKPSRETDLFAEEERILSSIESQAPAREEKTPSQHETAEEDEFILNESFNENEFPGIETGLKSEQKEEIPEFEPFKFDLEDIKKEEPANEEIKAGDEMFEITAEEMPPLSELDQAVETISLDAGEIAMSEPPQKLSTIYTVEDYGKVAVDLAKNSLNINRILIMKREGEKFRPIQSSGYKNGEIKMQADDPVITLFLSKLKGLDIKGNLSASRYLNERFDPADLNNINEIFIVPVVKKENVVGIAVYAKNKEIKEPTHYQKAELFNMSFLQEE